MLSIRNAEAKDYANLNAFLEKEGQLTDGQPRNFELAETVILTDEEDIFGYALAELVDYKPLITEIYIPEKLRKHLFGDATLRGLLFYFMNRGFEKVYAEKDSVIADFLRHEGFAEGEQYLEVVMNDFFNQKCRGCKGNE